MCFCAGRIPTSPGFEKKANRSFVSQHFFVRALVVLYQNQSSLHISVSSIQLFKFPSDIMSIFVAEEHIINMKRLLALSRSNVMDSHSALVGDSLHFDELVERLKTAEKHAADAVVAGKCADSALPPSIRSDVQKLQCAGSVSNMPNMFAESKRSGASKGLATAQETALLLLNDFALQHAPCSSPSHFLPGSHMLSAGVFSDVSLRSDARSLDKQVKALSRLKEVSVTEHTESARIRVTCTTSSFVAELILEKFLHCYEISSINIRPLKGSNHEIPSVFFSALRASAECRLAQLRQTCRCARQFSPLSLRVTNSSALQRPAGAACGLASEFQPLAPGLRFPSSGRLCGCAHRRERGDSDRAPLQSVVF